MASFLYYYRLWNGDMTISCSTPSTSLDDLDVASMPVEEAKAICLALTTQLLNKESEFKVAEDPLNSAYMLDHLYYLSLFKDFQGFQGGKPLLDKS
jgi:hypothetical protein